MNVRVEHRGSPVKHRPQITFLPATHLGWWAVGLAAAFLPFVFAQQSCQEEQRSALSVAWEAESLRWWRSSENESVR